MASTCSATSTATRSCASAVEAPRWGVTMTFGWRSSGLSLAGGSGSKTSSAAPAMVPFSSAFSSAASFTRLPRAMLIRRAPGFIFANSAPPPGGGPAGRNDGVERDEVALPQHLLEAGDADAQHLEPVRPDARVVGDDVHLQAARSARHL